MNPVDWSMDNNGTPIGGNSQQQNAQKFKFSVINLFVKELDMPNHFLIFCILV
jgi:hypothetical protein